MQPYLDIYVQKLLNEFESREIIVPKNEQESLKTDKLKKDEGIIEATQHYIFNDLFEFANNLRCVYSNLGYSDSSNASLKLMEIIYRLDKANAISAPWKNNSEVSKLMNEMHELHSSDPEYLTAVQKIIDDNEINFRLLNTQLFEFYGILKATQYFADFKYNPIDKARLLVDEFDFEMEPQNEHYPTLIFDFSYLKNAILPTKNSLLKSIKSFSLVNINGNENLYYFLVVFTGKLKEEFKKVRFEFSQIIKGIPEYEKFKDRINFLPVSIASLQLITEGYEEFKNDFIEREFKINFSDKIPPPNRPERNDYLYDKIFDITQSDIEIKINPMPTSPFWRFGIRYSATEDFPHVTEGRYNDKSIVVTEICVGNVENNVWVGNNKLWLQSYYSGDIKTERADLVTESYRGEEIRLIVKRRNASQIYFELIINNIVFRQKQFNIRLNKYCQLAAWADYTTFALNTEIKVIHRGNHDIIY